MFACPVCCFPLHRKPYETWPPAPGATISPPYYLYLGNPSYAVCRRCGFEFGFDDDPGDGVPGASFDEYRANWEAQGRPWFDLTAEAQLGSDNACRPEP